MIVSPRFLRQDIIQIKNAIGEDDHGDMQYSIAIIEGVKVDGSYGFNLSKRGVTTDDKILIIVDMNDFKSDKLCVDDDQFNDPSKQFTLRSDSDDLVLYENKEYRITNINPINSTKNAPFLLEIVCR